MLPHARIDLITQTQHENGAVTLVDTAGIQYQLPKFSAWILGRCDGTRDVETLAREALVEAQRLGLDESSASMPALVWQALDDLGEAGLLAKPVAPPTGATRRDSLWKIVASGAAATAVLGMGSRKADAAPGPAGGPPVIASRLLLEAEEDVQDAAFLAKDAEAISAAEQDELEEDVGRLQTLAEEETALAKQALALECQVAEALPLSKGWEPDAEFEPPSFVRRGGICVLSGLARSRGNTPVITFLPADCRPRGRLVFAVSSHVGTTRVDVLPDGQVQWMETTPSGWVSLSGLQFPVAPAAGIAGSCGNDLSSQERDNKMSLRRRHLEEDSKDRRMREATSKDVRKRATQEKTLKASARESDRKRSLQAGEDREKLSQGERQDALLRRAEESRVKVAERERRSYERSVLKLRKQEKIVKGNSEASYKR